jgi:hypothetical protein
MPVATADEIIAIAIGDVDCHTTSKMPGTVPPLWRHRSAFL